MVTTDAQNRPFKSVQILINKLRFNGNLKIQSMSKKGQPNTD
jgi:hypothetical protein